MMRKLFVLAIIAVVLGAIGAVAPAVAAEGYKVIAHSTNPATSLPRDQVARYLLKKSTAWPSGKVVAPVDLGKESAVREAFSRDVLHKSVAEATAYWQQQIFSGRGVPPPEKRTDAEVVAFVEGNEGAIGYVSAGAAVGDAKVVDVVE